MNTLKKCKIKDIAILNPTKNEVSKLGDIEVTFVPMEAVSNDGILLRKETRLLSEVKTGFTYFADDDILFAKITPCMENGKGCIAANLLNGVGFGSTEFHVIRVNKDVIYPRYLFHLLHSSQFRKQAASHMTGSAGQKRLPKKYLEEFEFILPTLEQQKVILQVLDKAQTLVDKRKQTIAKLDELVQAVFLDMFGDPVTNKKGWELILFKNAGSLDRGRSKHRPRNAPELLGGEYPLIQTGDVSKANVYITSFEQTYSELGLHQSKMWKKGTLCITIAANIAKTGILSFDACFPDSVVGFLPNECTNVHYVQCWLSFLQKILEEKAPESAQKNINLAILSELSMPLPPKGLQTKFAEIAEEIYIKRKLFAKSLQHLESNFHALLQKAFKGELKVKDGVVTDERFAVI